MSFHTVEREKHAQVNAAVAAGTGTTNTTGLDMSGYESVQWIVPIVTVLNTASIQLKLQDSADNSTFTDTDQSLTVTSAADNDANNKLMIVDAHRTDPDRKFVRLSVVRATANSALGVMTAKQYNPVLPTPITQAAASVAGTLLANNPR